MFWIARREAHGLPIGRERSGVIPGGVAHLAERSEDFVGLAQIPVRWRIGGGALQRVHGLVEFALREMQAAQRQQGRGRVFGLGGGEGVMVFCARVRPARRRGR